MAENKKSGHNEFRMSAPPQDIVAPVEVIEQNGHAHSAAALTKNGKSNSGFRLSAPPADREAPVEVVQEVATAASALDSAPAPEVPADLSISLKEPGYAEELGAAADPEQPPSEASGLAELSNEQIYRIIREVAVADSGDLGYSAISADREFDTAGHPSHQQRHIGLAFGLVLFTQESGRLGRVLQLMQQRDAGRFAQIFGPEAEELLAVTNAATREQRLQPVAGTPLWSQNWVEKFRRAGEVPAFQNAQNEEAIEGQFRPMLAIAAGLSLSSDRGLAMMYDRVVTRGLGGGLRWVVQAAGPLRTAAQRQHALRTLGYDSVSGFQRAAGVSSPEGVFNPQTHAALVAALRERGVLPLPSPHEMVCRIVQAATGVAKQRLLRLRDSSRLQDIVFRL